MTKPHELTIAQAATEIAARRLTSQSLVEDLFCRIDKLDPRLKAWVTVDAERALEVAHALDRELEERGLRSPLHGIPLGIKDIYYTAGLKTTACSKILADFVPTYDAASVERLREAGAIILGKTVTTEFASGDPPPTLNPWRPAHTPGGSSSGSAVAVAARMCPGAMGSQTGGSILRPAAYNGIVGFKPTFGRISVYGVIPLAWSLDTIGPMVNCVEDAAIMLQHLAGYDPRDPGCADVPTSDYLQAMNQLENPPRIGFIGGFFKERSEPEVWSHAEEVAQKLASAGAEVEIVKPPPSFANAHTVQWVVNNAETAAYHEKNFRTRASDYSEILRQRIELGILTPAVSYIQAQRLRRVFRREMDELARGWDLLLTPTTPTPAPRDLSTTGDPVFQSPWTSCGLPTITIPSGISPSTGLPLGTQLAAPPFRGGSFTSRGQVVRRSLGLASLPPGEPVV